MFNANLMKKEFQIVRKAVFGLIYLDEDWKNIPLVSF